MSAAVAKQRKICQVANILVQVEIAMVGKYTDLSDAYLSVIKSLQHACLAANRKLEILWVEASHLEEQTEHDDCTAYEVCHSHPLSSSSPKSLILQSKNRVCSALLAVMRQSGLKARAWKVHTLQRFSCRMLR